MKITINKLKNKGINFFKNMKYIVDSNKSFMYIFVVTLTVLGYGFFFNSNAIFKENTESKYTTPLYETKEIDNYKVEIRARKYSSKSNLVEFYVYALDNDSVHNLTLDFELREKSNPMENIDVDTRRLDKNNYIVRAKVPKNWSVLSLGVSTFNPLDIITEGEDTEDKKEEQSSENNKMKNSIKLYSEYDDMTKVSNLSEKNSNEYLAEGARLEIESLNKKIAEINQEKLKKDREIEAYKENINRLKEDKAYQTEIERQNTDSKISSIENIISTEENNTTDIKNKVSEYKEKISILEKKSRELLEK